MLTLSSGTSPTTRRRESRFDVGAVLLLLVVVPAAVAVPIVVALVSMGDDSDTTRAQTRVCSPTDLSGLSPRRFSPLFGATRGWENPQPSFLPLSRLLETSHDLGC